MSERKSPTYANATLPSIRSAVADDAAAIQTLYTFLIERPGVRVLPERIAEVGRDPMTRLLVAEMGGAVIGTLLVSFCSDVMFGRQPFAVIENVVVSPAMRGRGAGAALLREAERLCATADCSKVMLLSSASRSQAHAFFERAGYIGSSKQGFIKYRKQFSAPKPARLTP